MWKTQTVLRYTAKLCILLDCPSHAELTNLRRHVARHLTTTRETANESLRVAASTRQQSHPHELHEGCNATRAWHMFKSSTYISVILFYHRHHVINMRSLGRIKFVQQELTWPSYIWNTRHKQQIKYTVAAKTNILMTCSNISAIP